VSHDDGIECFPGKCEFIRIGEKGRPEDVIGGHTVGCERILSSVPSLGRLPRPPLASWKKPGRTFAKQRRRPACLPARRRASISRLVRVKAFPYARVEAKQLSGYDHRRGPRRFRDVVRVIFVLFLFIAFYFDLCSLAQQHPARQAFMREIDSLLAALRRTMPNGTSRRCLDRLSNRLTKILGEARKLATP
jgi:hypothetical protein